MKKRSIGSLLFGVAIGASLGVLFAPKKGKEIRLELKEKMIDLIDNAKSLSVDDVSNIIETKVNAIRRDLNDLDKEKVLKIAKEKYEMIKSKCQDLVDTAIDKGTPALKDTAVGVRDKTIEVMDDMIKRLETFELSTKDKKND